MAWGRHANSHCMSQWKPGQKWSACKASWELWNPLSKSVPSKFHGSGRHSKHSCLQEWANFHRSWAWQIVLIFSTALAHRCLPLDFFFYAFQVVMVWINLFFSALFLLRSPSFLDSVPEDMKASFIDGNPIAPCKLEMLKKMIQDRFPVSATTVKSLI